MNRKTTYKRLKGTLAKIGVVAFAVIGTAVSFGSECLHNVPSCHSLHEAVEAVLGDVANVVIGEQFVCDSMTPFVFMTLPAKRRMPSPESSRGAFGGDCPHLGDVHFVNHRAESHQQFVGSEFILINVQDVKPDSVLGAKSDYLNEFRVLGTTDCCIGGNDSFGLEVENFSSTRPLDKPVIRNVIEFEAAPFNPQFIAVVETDLSLFTESQHSRNIESSAVAVVDR